MNELRQTEEFRDWLRQLRDRAGRAIILRRINRLAQGNPGDVRSVGAGVSELRIQFGPGYRVYFTKRGTEFILLLCGGDKGSQGTDIARAKRMAELEVETYGIEDDKV